jgi:hypothetical protein
MPPATMDPPRSLTEHREKEEQAAREEAERAQKRKEALEAEAGPSTGEMQKEPGDAPPAPDVDTIVIDGGAQLDMFDLGGKRATSAVLNLKGKAEVRAGQGYQKGERIKFSGEAIVREAKHTDKTDKSTAQVVDCVATYGADILDLTIDGLE